MTKPPAILLVPGAYCTATHMQPLIEVLERRGHRVACSPLAGTGYAAATAADDVERIRSAAIRLLEEHHDDIIVVLHSFAGRSGGVALPGLARGERAAGDGGVIGVIHIAALVIPEDAVRARVAEGKKWESWQYEDPETGLLHVASGARRILFHDVPEPLVSQLVHHLQAQSVQAIMGVLPDGPRVATSPAFDGRRAYIYCTEDAALPAASQRGLVALSGTEWRSREMATSHSPFASQPEELARLIAELGEEFANVSS